MPYVTLIINPSLVNLFRSISTNGQQIVLTVDHNFTCSRFTLFPNWAFDMNQTSDLLFNRLYV